MTAHGSETSADQLNRRRAASRRCPELPDGRRDPLDQPKPRPKIAVRAIGSNTVEFTGYDQAVYNAIRTLDARKQRAPRGGSWLVKQDAADDVMALLESRGYFVEVTL